MNSEVNFDLARKLTCPVALISARQGDQDYHAMISTLSYASLDPLLFSTSIHNSSRTGQAILATGNLAISVLSPAHLEALTAFTTLLDQDSGDRQDQDKEIDIAPRHVPDCDPDSTSPVHTLPKGAPDGGDSLSRAGFLVEYFAETNLPYLADAAMALDARLVNKINLPQTTLIIFNVVSSAVGKSAPLIRYNRSYATLSSDLIAAKDSYPV